MFGYVRPSDDRLSAQDREVFHAAYCGLCHTLGQRYGLAGRMILNYDLTFLAMVLSEGAGETCGRRCAVHPLQKRSCAAWIIGQGWCSASLLQRKPSLHLRWRQSWASPSAWPGTS